MKKYLKPLLFALLVAAAVAGCNNPKSGRGFRLPDGNPEKGKQAFLALKCTACHRVDGAVDLPPPTRFDMMLGGETTRMRTYGELVTRVIRPEHINPKKYADELAKGGARTDFNHVMTVEQLIDLVAFLQAHYTLVTPDIKPPYTL